MRRIVRQLVTWCGGSVGFYFYVVALATIHTGCASVPIEVQAAAATAQSPLVACLLATPAQQSRHSGSLLPETVLVIGTTPMEDGERFKVVDGPDWNLDEWKPYARDKVFFGARCKSVSQSAFDASRREPLREPSERQP